ncbi:MAG: hypothetical protein D6679_02570 [Candidatus Hydrogenedentota bacterium]|nr:MAG: hypothetical protein D6679_02570 [Candidatus Hydrogenedentota bacterium]
MRGARNDIPFVIPERARSGLIRDPGVPAASCDLRSGPAGLALAPSLALGSRRAARSTGFESSVFWKDLFVLMNVGPFG